MAENYSKLTPQTSDTERQLLVKILIALGNGGGGGTNGGIQGGYADYSGGAPTFTPPAGTLGIAVDTSNSRLWLWTGSWI
jgi:hypothetical protein